MRDSLEFLFRQRFKSHESAVESGTWEAIQGKLTSAATTPDQRTMKDLFRERFQEHEVQVDPALWDTISSQLGHATAVGTVGSGSAILGWAAAGIGAIALIGGVYLMSTDDAAPPIVETRTEQPMAPGVQQQEAPIAELVVEPIAERSVPDMIDEQKSMGTTAAIDPGAIVERPVAKSVTPRESDTIETIVPNIIEPTAGEVFVQKIITDLTEQVKEEVLASPERSVSTNPSVAADQTSSTGPAADRDTRQEPKLFLQNTFTPNGDGVNDTYTVSMEGFERMIIKVFSVKNNQLVFSTNTSEPWTGDNCEDGYYLLAVEAMTAEGRLVSKGQVVWLNRTPQN